MGEIKISEVQIEKGSQKEVSEYIRSNHYSGTCNPVGYMWKLVTENDEIVGGIVFSNPISREVEEFVAGEGNHEEVLELNRLYTDDKCGKNMESWFISNALNKLKKENPTCRFVVSYSDTTEGHVGTVYQASNAIYTGYMGSRHSYRNNDGDLQATRSGDDYISIEEAKEMGWEVENRDKKHRYVFPLPDRYESRQEVIEDMMCPKIEYP